MGRIEYRGSWFESEPDESVLDALLRQGAELSYSCRKGSCQCCVQRLLSGEVRNSSACDPQLALDGHLLPCISIAEGDIRLAPPDPQHRSIEVELVDRRTLAADICELSLAPLRELSFHAGQHVQLIRDDGLSRPYSIVSLPGEDYCFRVHVRQVADGVMSRWLAEELRLGQKLHLRGAFGRAHYQSAMRERPLALLATGVGGGAMLALARDALGQGHRAPITLYHGVRSRWELYLHEELTDLQARHRHFRYVPAVSREQAGDGILHGRITELAFVDGDFDEHEIFLCGSPSMVAEARWRALLAGARRTRMHADPYHFQHPALPGDAARIAEIGAEPELWAALESGPGLTRILTRFYARVFVDSQLAPFFHKITQDRAIQKQYEFLADLMSGERNYFGLNPFNAHHWMVISDELFDYREELFEQVLRECDLPAALIRRWMALHERFRSDIVKAVPRGLISQGIEQPLHTHVIERLTIDTVCDGCGEEIKALRPSRYQYRSGTLHCASCAGIRE